MRIGKGSINAFFFTLNHDRHVYCLGLPTNLPRVLCLHNFGSGSRLWHLWTANNLAVVEYKQFALCGIIF